MKKLFAVMLAVLLVMSFAACGSEEEAEETVEEAVVEETVVEETPVEEPVAEETTEEVTEPTQDNPVVNLYGTFDKSLIKGTVLVTSVGQSADTDMIGTLLTKVGVEYTLNASITADEVGEYGTVIVVAGASTKGLGAAGISIEDELTRAESLLAACEANGCTVIMCHIGGSARRGSMSDQFTDVVMKYSCYMIVVAEGNTDGYFTDYCEANNIPLTLVVNTKSSMTPLQDIFGE